MVWPELTTVRRPISEMARQAVRLLIEQVRAKRSGSLQVVEHKLLNFTLITRESSVSAPPAKRKGKQ
jgi:LacI family transcriptional regulator